MSEESQPATPEVSEHDPQVEEHDPEVEEHAHKASQEQYTNSNGEICRIFHSNL